MNIALGELGEDVSLAAAFWREGHLTAEVVERLPEECRGPTGTARDPSAARQGARRAVFS